MCIKGLRLKTLRMHRISKAESNKMATLLKTTLSMYISIRRTTNKKYLQNNLNMSQLLLLLFFVNILIKQRNVVELGYNQSSYLVFKLEWIQHKLTWYIFVCIDEQCRISKHNKFQAQRTKSSGLNMPCKEFCLGNWIELIVLTVNILVLFSK